MHKILLVTLIFTLLILVLSRISREVAADLLVYRLNNFDGKPSSLKLYDPASGMTVSLIVNRNFSSFSLSAEGRLAYTLNEAVQTDIYIWDIRALGQKPVNITQTQDVNEDVLSWSPDGRYLVYEAIDKHNRALIYLWDGESIQDITPHKMRNRAVQYGAFWSPDSQYLAFVAHDDNNYAFIHVWDGEKVSDITPQNMPDSAKYYEVTWSPNGLLAFNAWFWMHSTSEIYLWDGTRTMNLSQSPENTKSWLDWSADGKLAFQAERDRKYTIRVWDGVSFKNGAPDKDSFTSVAPGMIGYYSVPTWTPQGQVAFVSQTAHDTHTQVYVWDGKTATNISQNPTLHNGTPVWSNDGLWAFTTYFSPTQLLYVRDAHGRILLTTEGQYTPAWSSNDELVFCTGGWTLSVWNGQTITEIANAREIDARWQSGGGVACSSG